MGKKSRFATVQSLLFAILTSGKYWRCIRWCDNGTAVLITSPQLFEREVLRGGELKALNLMDFATFAKMLKTIGFQRVLSARTSKAQKFRHPGFQINGKKVNDDKKGKEKEETKGKRKRSMTRKKRDETRRQRQVAGTESKRFKKDFETPKKTKRRGKMVNEDLRGRTAVKRKRDPKEMTTNENYVHAKKQKQNTFTTVSSANHTCNPNQVRMPRGYCLEEITAAHAMLGLLTSIISMQNFPVHVMLAHNLVDSYKSLVLFVKRSAREIEAAQALMELAAANINR